LIIKKGENSVFCKNCGAKLDDDAAFCDNCGTEIKTEVTSNESVPTQAAIPNDSAVRNGAEETQAKTPATSGKKRSIVLAAVAVAVVAIAVAAVLLLKSGISNGSVSDSRAEGNFNNGARMAFDDDALYFVGLFNDDDSETSVYSTSYTGTNKTLISDNQDIRKIRIANGKILYETSGDDTYSIGVMDKDGSNDSVIIELSKGSDDSLYDFDASASSLYYIYNGELRSCSMDGTDDTLLVEGAEEFVMGRNTLYYATEDSIFSYDIKKNQSTEICSSEANGLILDDGKIYFSNDSGIYSVATTGEERAQQIAKDSSVGNFILNGEDIYYIQALDTDEIISLAKAMSEDDYKTYAVLMLGAGYIECVPKLGGTPYEVDSNQFLSVALYAYPDGMYSKMNWFTKTLTLIEFD
jgi:hypothetical protein